VAAERIFLLTLYPKSERDNLGSSDLRKIKKLVQELGDA